MPLGGGTGGVLAVEPECRSAGWPAGIGGGVAVSRRTAAELAGRILLLTPAGAKGRRSDAGALMLPRCREPAAHLPVRHLA